MLRLRISRMGSQSVFVVLLMAAVIWPWQKGTVNRAQVLKDFMDLNTSSVAYFNNNYVWSDSAGNYIGADLSQWPGPAILLALDGTDSQLTLCGVSRDELKRRVQLSITKKGVHEALDDRIMRTLSGLTRETWLVAVSKADSAWKLPRLAPDVTLGKKKNLLGFSGWMDYGRAQTGAVLRPVPQDLADPRMLGGKPIKEWMRQWNCPLEGWTNGTAYDVTLCFYAPDFSSDHHGFVNPVYAECPERENTHRGTWGIFFQKLLQGQQINEMWTTPYSHIGDLGDWFSIMAPNHVWVQVPTRMENRYSPLMAQFYAAAKAALYGDSLSLTYLSRKIEASRKWSAVTDYGQDVRFYYQMVYAYLFLRLIPDCASVGPDYAKAKKTFDNTYWFRPHQYVVHRTPEKFVCLSWNGDVRTDGSAATWPSTSSFPELPNYAKARFGRIGGGTYLNILPDNPDSVPDEYVPLVKPGIATLAGGFSGSSGFGLEYGTGSGVRMERSDAVVSSARMQNIWMAWAGSYNEYGKQYVSFTSFADKLCIAMVRAVDVSSSGWVDANSTWQNAFALCFNKGHSSLDCSYEGGKLNLKTASNQSLSSSWYSVNGLVGAAVIGGTGTFSLSGLTGTYPNGNGVLLGWSSKALTNRAPIKIDQAALFAIYTPGAVLKQSAASAVILDSLLPLGWKGVVAATPDSQRDMALVRFYGSTPSATIKMTFPEGAPIFENRTTFNGDTGITTFTFDSLQSLGQTLCFYTHGAVTEAEQAGDLAVRLKGNGNAILKYLSRDSANVLYVNDIPLAETKSREQLKQGISLALTDVWTTVRIQNKKDDDHSGPGVDVLWPQYLSDEQCKVLGIAALNDVHPDVNKQFAAEPAPVSVGESGLEVRIGAKDRSGVQWVKVYLDWDSVALLTQPPYTFNIPKSRLDNDSIHAIHAVACDVWGNISKSVSVPFRVSIIGGTGIERAYRTGLDERFVAGNIRNNSTTSKISAAASGAKSKALYSSADFLTAQGRVQLKPKASAEKSGLCFDYNRNNYVFGLDSEKGKVILFRRNASGLSLVGEASVKLKSGVWYDLKTRIAGNSIVCYVNDIERLRISE